MSFSISLFMFLYFIFLLYIYFIFLSIAFGRSFSSGQISFVLPPFCSIFIFYCYLFLSSFLSSYPMIFLLGYFWAEYYPILFSFVPLPFIQFHYFVLCFYFSFLPFYPILFSFSFFLSLSSSFLTPLLLVLFLYSYCCTLFLFLVCFLWNFKVYSERQILE